MVGWGLAASGFPDTTMPQVQLFIAKYRTYGIE
jgi:hypothetical protein